MMILLFTNLIIHIKIPNHMNENCLGKSIILFFIEIELT